MTKRDNTAGGMRGLMLDPARCLERKEYYLNLIPRLADWGYNALFLHFTDDQGCMVKFRSAPGIAAPHAFSRKEMERLIAAAGRHGIDVVPELECLGHIRYLTDRPRFRRLFHRVHNAQAFAFNSLCPAREESLDILDKLIRETAALFPSRYLHAGLDEVCLDRKCPRCRQRFGREPDDAIYAWWVNQIHGKIAASAKTMMMWGDHLAKSPAMLVRISKDIVICHWDYSPGADLWGKARADRQISALSGKGFRVLLCPSMFCWGEMVLPGRHRFANTARSAVIAERHFRRGEHVLGVVNTVWVGWRFDAHALSFATAWAGAAFRRSGAVPSGFGAAFCRDYFGIRPRNAARLAGGALEDMRRLPPLGRLAQAALPGRRGMAERPRVGDADRKALLAEARRILRLPAARAGAWRRARGQVGKNRGDFDALAAGFDLAAFLCRQVLALQALGVSLREAARDPERCGRVQAMAQQVRRHQHRWDGLWRRHRYPDDPLRRPSTPQGRIADNIFGRLALCADELERLARVSAGRPRRRAGAGRTGDRAN